MTDLDLHHIIIITFLPHNKGMQLVFQLTGKLGKTPVFKTIKPVLCTLKKPVLADLIFGCQNCTEKRAETYFIGILEAKLIAHLQPKF